MSAPLRVALLDADAAVRERLAASPRVVMVAAAEADVLVATGPSRAATLAHLRGRRVAVLSAKDAPATLRQPARVAVTPGKGAPATLRQPARVAVTPGKGAPATLRQPARVAATPGEGAPDSPVDAAAQTDSFVADLARVAGRPGAGRDDGPPVSVVVTVLDEQDAIAAVVDTVAAQLAPADELVVVDGGSHDATHARLRERATTEPRLTVVEAPGTNISAGRNAGIRAARNDVIATTDAGCAPVDGWLEALRAPFAEHDPPGLVAGNAAVAASGPFERAQALACYPDPAETRNPDLAVRIYGRLFGTVFDPTLPFARSLAFSRAAWEAAGGFPEDLGWTEDGVFGRSVAETHDCVLAADAVVSWQQHLSVPDTIRMYHRYGRGAAASGSRQLVARDAIRAAAYAGAAGALVVRGRRAVAPLALGATAYLSLPLRRIARHGAGPRAAAWVPVALATKDLGKVAGAASTYLGRRATGPGTRQRVMFVVPDMRVGGAERHAALILGGLPAERFDRELTCLAGAGPMAAALDGVDVTPLHATSLPQALARLAAHMRRAQPDVVMTFGLSADIAGRIAARAARVPTVACWKHNVGHLGAFGDRERRAERLSGGLVDRYFAVSNAQVGYLTDTMKLDRDRIRVIPNGLDPTAYEPAAGRDDALAATLGLPPGPVIVTVAALREEKDHATLLRALVPVRERLGDVSLLVVGDGPERAALEALTAELGLTGAVVFLGNRSDVAALLPAADVAVLASFTIENAPYSVLEAMASALPVVTTDVGALRELVHDTVTGRLVPPRDPPALAGALVDVLGRADLGRSLGAAGRRRLEDRFDLRDAVAQLIHELAEVAT